MISAVTKWPVLTYPDFGKDFILHVDASKYALGCSLYQQQQDQLGVVGYGSRTRVGVEKCNDSSKLEYPVLKWAACDHFKPYTVKFLLIVTPYSMQCPEQD